MKEELQRDAYHVALRDRRGRSQVSLSKLRNRDCQMQ